WSQSISYLQIVVKWVFKEMVSMFGFFDYVKNQKHLLQPIGVQFRVAVLLYNIYVYLHRLQITQYFEFSNPV
ncbi:hypothetical protein L873DRAFT_1661936, partial [Choiromyces venosus 120613-1]